MLNHVELKCLQCGQAFTVTKRSYRKCRLRFCSLKCHTDYKANMWTEITCEWCGKKKLVRKIYVKRGQYKYCSDVCRRDARRQGLSKDDLRRVCKTCGKVFYTTPSRLKRDHCSIECRKRRPFKNCEQCGKRFDYGRTQTNRRFCSNECYKAHDPETTIETTVRKFLEDLGIEFECQKGFGRFVVDFVLPDLRIIIEADGSYWHSKKVSTDRDERRDSYLKSKGYEVIHLPETEIKSGAFRERLECLN